MTPYPRPSRPNASRARCLLATLVLTVLTLVIGATSATGAALAPPTSGSLAPAVTAAASALTAPRPQHAGHHAGHDSRHRAGHNSRHHAGRNSLHDFRHRAGQFSGSDRGEPDRASGVVAASSTAAGAVAQAGHEQPRAAADPAQAPRAGTGRAYLLLHAPPPPHDALTPAPPAPAEPCAGVQHVVADSSDVPGGRRGALPGVRGPPGRTTGPTTGHPSCSADPAPRPH
ncbi:hypothetical protein [Streptomyces sp. McG3]|uniref:hypothetical protein n=1 Tax=Streptomyces sp. McG3 TaxID=2725483 RepID=UPI001BED1C79|nr:hypothetical protein [Streptomyces sp. McG3]MBT2897460.1 hypothetical protein [Streptomyces sp. McG3]